MKLTRIHILLITITIVGAAIRLSQLGWNSLWLDEAATLWFASKGYIGVWNSVLSGEYNPPLFYWLEVFMLNFGRSEFVLRFIPCVAGIATIPATCLLGKEWRNESIGLAGAALLAFSPYHVYFSQEARAYTLVILFAVLMMWAYLKACKSQSYTWWITTAAFAALAFWTHFYVFILIAFLFMYALWNTKWEKEKLKRVLISGVAYVWFTLPIVLATFYLLKLRTDEAPTFGIQGAGIIPDLLWNFGLHWNISSVLFFLLFCLGLWVIWRTAPPKALFAAFIFFGCLLITIPLSLKIPMVSRYLLYLLPFYLLIISEPILHYLKDKRVQTIILCALIALGTGPLWQMQTQFTKDDWRGFATYLTERTKDGDVVITCPAYMDLPLNYYYNNTTDKTTMKPGSNLTEIQWYTVPDKTWFVMTPDVGAVVDARPIPNWLEQNAEFVNKWEFYVYLYHG